MSTGTDEVIRLRLRGVDVMDEVGFWRPDRNEPRQDVHHLNSLIESHGELLVSGFGKKEGDRWSSARSGFVRNLTRHQVLASGIDQPHTLLEARGRIFFCESQRMAVRALGSHLQQLLSGYTRGLGVVGNDLFVATSVGRRVSKSTGKVDNPAALGTRNGHCTISRLSLEDLSLLETAHFDEYANEIYDILPLEGTTDWPVIEDWRGPAILGLSAALDRHSLWARQSSEELVSRERTVRDLQNQLRQGEVEMRELKSLQTTVQDQGRRLVELGHAVDSLRETAGLLSERLDPKTAARMNYLLLTRRVRRTIDEALSVGSIVIVASKGDDSLLSSNDRSCWHFPQSRDGTYSGSHPACSASAVGQLEALRDRGASTLSSPGDDGLVAGLLRRIPPAPRAKL